MLKSYFGLTDAKMDGVLKELYELYSITGIAVSNAYNCPESQGD